MTKGVTEKKFTAPSCLHSGAAHHGTHSATSLLTAHAKGTGGVEKAVDSFASRNCVTICVTICVTGTPRQSHFQTLPLCVTVRAMICITAPVLTHTCAPESSITAPLLTLEQQRALLQHPFSLTLEQHRALSEQPLSLTLEQQRVDVPPRHVVVHQSLALPYAVPDQA